MIQYLTNVPNLDGDGGLGLRLQDALNLTIPQVNALAHKITKRQLSSEEVRQKAIEAYRSNPEAYRRKIEAEHARARKLTSGKK